MPDGQPSIEDRPYCGTIHSLIYRPCDCLEPRDVAKPCPQCSSETLWLSGQSVCEAGHVGAIKTEEAFKALESKYVYVQKLPDGSCPFSCDKGWARRDILDRNYGLLIVDEASMVADEMVRDLQSFNFDFRGRRSRKCLGRRCRVADEEPCFVSSDVNRSPAIAYPIIALRHGSGAGDAA